MSFSRANKYLYPYVTDFYGIFGKLSKLNKKPDQLIIALPNTMSKSLNVILRVSKKIPMSFDFGGLWTSFFDRGKVYDAGLKKLRLVRPLSQFYEDSLILLLSRCPELITVPTSGLNFLFKQFSGRTTYTVYQPVDTSKDFNPSLIDRKKALENIPQKFKDAYFVAIGVKGDEWFIPLFEKLARKFQEYNVFFMVPGSFPNAESALEKKGVAARFFFTGNIPYSVLPSYIALTHFSLVLTHPDLTSIWYSPHNIAKITDYLAMGKPVITDAPSAIDYIEHGTTGFFVRNESILLDRVECMLNDNALVRKMGEAARRTACDKFDNIRIAQRYLQLMQHSTHL
jgi:glycosyltransferase involved in cell wall biosynthesis